MSFIHLNKSQCQLVVAKQMQYCIRSDAEVKHAPDVASALSNLAAVVNSLDDLNNHGSRLIGEIGPILLCSMAITFSQHRLAAYILEACPELLDSAMATLSDVAACEEMLINVLKHIIYQEDLKVEARERHIFMALQLIDFAITCTSLQVSVREGYAGLNLNQKSDARLVLLTVFDFSHIVKDIFDSICRNYQFVHHYDFHNRGECRHFFLIHYAALCGSYGCFQALVSNAQLPAGFNTNAVIDEKEGQQRRVHSLESLTQDRRFVVKVTPPQVSLPERHRVAIFFEWLIDNPGYALLLFSVIGIGAGVGIASLLKLSLPYIILGGTLGWISLLPVSFIMIFYNADKDIACTPPSRTTALPRSRFYKSMELARWSEDHVSRANRGSYAKLQRPDNGSESEGDEEGVNKNCEYRH